jgi:CBS domain containing-hemolysin-like protein
LGLAAVLLLTLGTAFFVAGEFALVAVDRTRIERLADEEHRGAVSTLKALRALSFQLSGAQLGITITSLVVGFIVEPTIGRSLEPLIADLGWFPEGSSLGIAVTIALILATAIQMVLGELVPKNVAIARPLGTAFAVAAPLRAVNTAFGPIIRAFNASANGTVRMLGIEPRDELTSVYSLEELEVMIHSSRKGGAIEEEDFSLLARAITFGEKAAADALVPRTSIIAIAKDQTLADLAALAVKSGHSRFPVTDENLDEIIGVAHIKDSYAIARDERSRLKVSEIMREVLAVPESHELDSLLARMRRDKNQMAVILDEFGGTAGIVTLEDLLEEIVGEIEDEYDPGSGIRETSPDARGIHVLSGLLHPDEVRERCGFEMPEGDYETLGGFLFSLLGRIPKPGDHAGYQGWEFKITEMEGNRIATVLLVGENRREESER